MYETCADTPDTNTFAFLVFVILHTMREERAYRANVLQASATMTAASESEQATQELQKQMQQFAGAFFPYTREETRKQDKKMRDILDKMKGTAFKVTRTR